MVARYWLLSHIIKTTHDHKKPAIIVLVQKSNQRSKKTRVFYERFYLGTSLKIMTPSIFND